MISRNKEKYMEERLSCCTSTSLSFTTCMRADVYGRGGGMVHGIQHPLPSSLPHPLLQRDKSNATPHKTFLLLPLEPLFTFALDHLYTSFFFFSYRIAPRCGISAAPPLN